MTQPLVSVLTPVHDTARYLPQCIESVLGQDYPCLEYLIVDNWSADGSGEIARRYANIDPRVRIVSPPAFLEQVPNYNFGLRQVSPQASYVKIVQADEWIFPGCLDAMVAVAEENPRVGIVGSYALRETEVLCDGLPFPSATVSGREICRRQLRGELFVFGSPTQLMYRADVVRARTPFFCERSLHEDTEACYEILRDWDFGFVHQVLTFWRCHEDSISGRTAAFQPNMLDGFIAVTKFGRDFLDGPELATCLGRAERAFYRGLADAVMRLEGRAFWRYQLDGLRGAGLPLDRRKLAKQIALRAGEVLLNPGAAVRALLRRLRGHRG